jgi:hypothetical protein
MQRNFAKISSIAKQGTFGQWIISLPISITGTKVKTDRC